jgi:hypothetical protein
MASHATSVSLYPVSAHVDPAYWSQDLSDSSTLALNLSPTGSSATQESINSITPPALATGVDRALCVVKPQNDPAAQAARTSVAVACVPCRTRHLKCDGGVRCSRCRAEGVECSYIKSRRGWKGKRKSKPGEQGPTPVPVQVNG